MQVNTDYEPFVAMNVKSIAQAPAKLQRMIQQLKAYDPTLTHIPGKDIPLSDTLSRECLSDIYSQLSAWHGLTSTYDSIEQSNEQQEYG